MKKSPQPAHKTAGKHCARCDYKEGGAVIDKLGHDLEHHDAQAASCTAIGWDEYNTCKRCDYTTYNEIAALGHNVVCVAEVPATYENTGVKEYYKCEMCNKLFGDADCTYEVTTESLVIDKLPPILLDGDNGAFVNGGNTLYYCFSLWYQTAKYSTQQL